MKSDAILRVKFFPPEAGGRRSEVGSNADWRFYSCPLFVAEVDHGFDVRIHSDLHPLRFGQEYDVEAIFLSPGEARLYFLPGVEFTLWEGRTVGVGSVIKASWAVPSR